LAQVGAAHLLELMQPKGFNLGADSWLEMARDPHGQQQMATLNQQLRDTLTKVLLRGQAEGWVRPQLNCLGAASLILALLSGLAFDYELGLASEAAATASALADMVTSFILL
jgi:hypothetical protein